MGDFPSGQRGQTVNLLQIASVVRIHHRPFRVRADLAGMAELADARDLKSREGKTSYRFDSGCRHDIIRVLSLIAAAPLFSSSGHSVILPSGSFEKNGLKEETILSRTLSLLFAILL